MCQRGTTFVESSRSSLECSSGRQPEGRGFESRGSRHFCRSVAQSGSAPGLGPGGRWFESIRSDQFECREAGHPGSTLHRPVWRRLMGTTPQRDFPLRRQGRELERGPLEAVELRFRDRGASHGSGYRVVRASRQRRAPHSRRRKGCRHADARRRQEHGRPRERVAGEHAYDVVYRHSFDIDRTGDVLAMGSTTGSLWISEDQGDSWTTVSTFLPPIYCARFA